MANDIGGSIDVQLARLIEVTEQKARAETERAAAELRRALAAEESRAELERQNELQDLLIRRIEDFLKIVSIAVDGIREQSSQIDVVSWLMHLLGLWLFSESKNEQVNQLLRLLENRAGISFDFDVGSKMTDQSDHRTYKDIKVDSSQGVTLGDVGGNIEWIAEAESAAETGGLNEGERMLLQFLLEDTQREVQKEAPDKSRLERLLTLVGERAPDALAVLLKHLGGPLAAVGVGVDAFQAMAKRKRPPKP